MKDSTKVRLLYDRRHQASMAKKSSVDIEVSFDRTCRVYRATGIRIYPWQWDRDAAAVNQSHPDAQALNTKLQQLVLETKREVAAIRAEAGTAATAVLMKQRYSRKSLETAQDRKVSFLSYMAGRISQKGLAEGTRRRYGVTLTALIRFGRMDMVADLTAENVAAFDMFLRAEEPSRTDQAVYNYHKCVRAMIRELVQVGIVQSDPYVRFRVPRGKSKERRPLTASELQQIRDWKPVSRETEKARDHFVFQAYTGLSYADAQAFRFSQHAEMNGSGVFIDGERMKTKERFYTPLMGPALEVLCKYGGERLPTMEVQVINRSLHLIERDLGLNKPLTSHVARHTFATLSLSSGVQVTTVQKMLGHADIRTTQVYAKVLHDDVQDAMSRLQF